MATVVQGSNGVILPGTPGAGGEIGLWCSGEESLRLTSINADADAAVVLTGRFLQVGRLEPIPIFHRHVPNTDRTAATVDVPLGEGWLSGLSIIASSGSPIYAHTYIRVDLIRGRGTAATVLQTLLAGPVSALARRAWPGSPIADSIEGRGAIRSITGTNPAAGAEISETVPTGARWLVRSLQITFVTSAAVASRATELLIDDGATVYCRIPAAAAQAASTTAHFSFALAGGVHDGAVVPSFQRPFPFLYLLAGHRIRTLTEVIQAGDDYGAPQLLVEEWLEAA